MSRAETVHRETLEILKEKHSKLISKTAIIQSIDVQLGVAQTQLTEANLVILQVLFYLRDGVENAASVTDYLPKHILGEEVVEAWQEKQPELAEKAFIEYESYQKVLPPSYALVPMDSNVEEFQLTQDALEGNETSREELIKHFESVGNQEAAKYWADQRVTRSVLELPQDYLHEQKRDGEQDSANPSSALDTLHVPSEVIEVRRQEIENEEESRLKEMDIAEIAVTSVSLKSRTETIHAQTIEILKEKHSKLISKTAIIQSIDVQLGVAQTQLTEANLVILQVLFYLRDGVENAASVTDYLPKHILGEEVVEAWQEKQPELAEKAFIEYESYQKVLPPSYALVPMDSNVEEFHLIQDALEGNVAAREKLITYFDKKGNQEAVIYWRHPNNLSFVSQEITRDRPEIAEPQMTEKQEPQIVKLPDEVMDSKRKEAENEEETRLEKNEEHAGTKEPTETTPQIVRLPSVVIEANKKQAEIEEEERQNVGTVSSEEAPQEVGVVRLPSVVIEANKKQAEDAESKQIEAGNFVAELQAETGVVRIPSVVLEANRIKSEEEELKKLESISVSNVEDIKDVPKAAPQPPVTESTTVEQNGELEKEKETVTVQPAKTTETAAVPSVELKAVEEKEPLVETKVPVSVQAEAPELKPELKKEAQAVPTPELTTAAKIEKVVEEESKVVQKEPQALEKEEPPKQEQPKPVDPMNTQPKPTEQKPKAEPEKTSTCCGCF
jgi:uncharacterized protein YciU (UPF0263 family)